MSKGGKVTGASAHIVAVSMGYGHERPAHALRFLSPDDQIYSANDYEGIPASDRQLWDGTRTVYERISRFKKVPLLGPLVFGVMDEMQVIAPFYPRRDLSRPSLQLLEIYAVIRRRNWCKHLVDTLAKNPLPMICTFPTPAFAAEEFGYPGDIYLVTTDTDINRAWAPKDTKRSRIKYLAANGRVRERLKLYGVKEDHIELTGFPLPKECVGGYPAKTIIGNLKRRICNLDPNGTFVEQSGKLLDATLGPRTCSAVKRKKAGPVHVAFAVGGAGAQQEIGAQIVTSLKNDIRRGRIQVTLVAGIRPEVASYFEKTLKDLELFAESEKGQGVNILFETDRQTYFDKFTALMNDIDILWTKPSELSFYTGLGIPVIMCPTVGSQEDFNHRWLEQVGGGVDQLDPRYANEWLFDWIESGALAKKAWNGFIEAPTHGAYRIEDIIAGRPNTIHPLPLIV